MGASKLQSARARIARAAELTGGSVLVALSGGKDSLVTLELCVEHFRRVEAFYMYHVLGLQCVERSVDAAARRAGVVLHKVPHPQLSHWLRASLLRPHQAAVTSQIRALKQIDVEHALTAQTGIGWFAYGERAADNFARRLYTRVNDGIRVDWHRIYPVWDWLHAEVVSYLKMRRIPLPERLGASDGKAMTGFSLRPDALHWMKHSAPEDYARVREVFPYAEAMVMRYEIEAARRKPEPAPRKARVRKRSLKRGFGERGAERGAEQVPEVRSAAGASLDAEECALQPAQDR